MHVAPPTTSFADRLLDVIPAHWPAQVDLLDWCQQVTPGVAAFLVLAGIIYLLFGWYMFKVLVVINATLVGAFFGAVIGAKAGSPPAGAILGAFTAAALTVGLMRHTVAIMGATFGAILGASLWLAGGLETHLAWAGAGMGLIFFGMLSLVLFRGSIIVYTSLQGAAMFVFGVMGLVFKYNDVASRLCESMLGRPYLLPMAIFIPAILGLLYQQTHFPAEVGKK